MARQPFVPSISKDDLDRLLDERIDQYSLIKPDCAVVAASSKLREAFERRQADAVHWPILAERFNEKYEAILKLQGDLVDLLSEIDLENENRERQLAALPAPSPEVQVTQVSLFPGATNG